MRALSLLDLEQAGNPTYPRARDSTRMSWDVLVVAAESRPPPVDELPQDWKPRAIGSGDAVRAKICERLDNVDWSDRSFGIFDGPGFSLEFNLGADEPIESFMVHVRGSGDAVRALLELARPNGWWLLDCSNATWIESDDAQGWQRFQSYRDQLLQKPPKG